MTELTDRLRFELAEGYTICGEAADEIEHLALDLQTERAAVVALRENGARLLTVADSAVQHQRGMIEVATEPLRAEVAALREELANARAIDDVHSCHDGCTQSGCVAGRLTAERDALLAEVANLTEERKAVMILLTEVVFTNILTLADSDILQNKALRMIERMRGGRE